MNRASLRRMYTSHPGRDIGVLIPLAQLELSQEAQDLPNASPMNKLHPF